jgi:hypothetical protein
MKILKFVSASAYIQSAPHRLRLIARLEIFVLCVCLALQFKFSAITRVARHFKLSKIEVADLIIKECDVPIEILIVSSHKDIEILPMTIESILKNCINPIDCITLIVQKNSIATVSNLLEQFTDVSVTFRIHDEETLVSQEFRNHLAEIYKNRYGWVLQQVLKIDYVLNCNKRGVLVFDADTVLLKRMGFLQRNSRQVLLISSELHSKYFAQLLLLGFHPIKPWMSTVAHHMLIQPDLLRSALKEIQAKSAEDLIRTIEEKDVNLNSSLSPFSIDYELYGQWLMSNKKEIVMLKLTENIELRRSLESTRLVEDLLLTDQSKLKFTSASLHSYL